MKRSSLHSGILSYALLAYLVVALPLPAVLLDHELGILTGDPSHSAHDDHAWLDHAAGDGMASSDGVVAPDTLMAVDLLPDRSSFEFLRVHLPSARGPPPLLS